MMEDCPNCENDQLTWSEKLQGWVCYACGYFRAEDLEVANDN